jgi:hypothetical protein
LIFDTDVVIWMLRRHPEAIRFARAAESSGRNISIVSYLELLRGCRKRGEATYLDELVNEWFTQVVPLTPGISEAAAALMRQFALSRRPGVDDILIAATAMARGEAVATGNVRHFDFVPGLVVRPFRAAPHAKGKVNGG